MTYSQYVGLQMNVRRIREGRVLEHLRAICYAHNNEDLPASLFEIIAGSSEQAQDIAFDVNAKRRVSKMMGEGFARE